MKRLKLKTYISKISRTFKYLEKLDYIFSLYFLGEYEERKIVIDHRVGKEKKKKQSYDAW